MKQLLFILFLLPSLLFTQQRIEIVKVFDQSITLPASGTVAREFQFNNAGDSIAYQIEVFSASLGSTSPAGDSLSISVRVLPVSQSFMQDTTQIANWPLVVNKTASQGRVAFGNNISYPLSKQTGAKGRVSITNTKALQQTTVVRVYAIKKWR